MEKQEEKIPRGKRIRGWFDLYVFGDGARRPIMSSVFFALLLAWGVFVALTNWAQIDAFAALILLLVSLFVLLVARFPAIADRIKSFKYGDLTVDMREVSSKSDPVALQEMRGQVGASGGQMKGNIANLATVLVKAQKRDTDWQVLIINVPQANSSVTPSELLAYSAALELVRPCDLAALFVSGPRREYDGELTQIRASDIVGAVSNRALKDTVAARYRLEAEIDNYSARIRKAIEDVDKEFDDSEEKAWILYNRLNEMVNEINDTAIDKDHTLLQRISKSDILKWFGKRLSTIKVQSQLKPDEQYALRDAILQDHEYVLVLDGERLRAVAPTGEVTKVVVEKLFATIAASE